jgi:hypothetical protein
MARRLLLTLCLLLFATSHAVADPLPYAALASPLNGGVVPRDELTYIDVSYLVPSGESLDHTSVSDLADEFSLTGQSLSFMQPMLLMSTTYRYLVAGGSVVAGLTQVDFLAGAFADSLGNLNEAETETFEVTPLDGDLDNPGNGGFIDVDTLNGRGYLEIRYTSDFALDLASILDAGLEFQLVGDGASTVTVDDGNSEEVGDGSETDVTIRYPFLGEFGLGSVQAQFMAGSWTDIAGSLNPDNAEIFHVVPEPGTGVLLVLGLAVLATRRRRPRYRAQRGAVSKPTATRR